MGRTRRQRNECRTPHKRRFTMNEAAEMAEFLGGVKGQRGLSKYKCRSGGHWHVGRRRGR